MDLTSLLIQAASGAIGGNAAAAATKNNALGTLGNTLAGALGGGLGGQLLGPLLEIDTAGLDIGAIVSGFATGGVSGAITALAASWIKSKLA